MVTIGHRGLQSVTRDNRGYKALPGNTGLHWVTGGFKRLPEITRGYSGLQGVNKGVTMSYKPLQVLTGDNIG